MIFSSELDELLKEIRVRADIDALPPPSVIRYCRDRAIELNDDSGDLVIEIAALFYAFSVEPRLEDDQRRIPIWIVWFYVENALLDVDPDAVIELQGTLAQDDLESWPDVRQWFRDHVTKRHRPRSR